MLTQQARGTWRLPKPNESQEEKEKGKHDPCVLNNSSIKVRAFAALLKIRVSTRISHPLKMSQSWRNVDYKIFHKGMLNAAGHKYVRYLNST